MQQEPLNKTQVMILTLPQLFTHTACLVLDFCVMSQTNCKKKTSVSRPVTAPPHGFGLWSFNQYTEPTLPESLTNLDLNRIHVFGVPVPAEDNSSLKSCNVGTICYILWFKQKVKLCINDGGTEAEIRGRW